MNSVDPADTIRFLIDNQKELWFQHEQLPEQHPGISCGGQFTISGPLDVKLFYRALKATIDTDELFTATLSKDPLKDIENPDPAFPYFILGKHPIPDYKFVDISHYNDPDKEAEIRAKRFIEKKFQPLGGKLCRFLLLKLDDQKYCFLSFYIHLVTDGINALAHYNRISRLYSELKLTGEAHPQQMNSLSVLQEDEKNYKNKPRYQKDVEFWKQKMEDLKSDFIFPNLPGTNESKVTISRLEMEFPSECTDLLALFTESEKVSAYAVLLALEYLALSRTYDRDDFVILVPMRFIASRLAEQTSGYTVNVVPMQLKIDQQSSFRELVRKVSGEILAMVRHARCAWQPVLRDSGIKISSDPRGRNTWVSINLDKVNPEGVETDSVTAITSMYDQVALNIYLIQSSKDENLHLSIDYSNIQFTKSSVERHFERYFYLLEQCLRSPDRPLYKLDYLLDSEKRRLDHCEAGWAEKYETGSIAEIIGRRSEHYPDNIAIIDDAGPVTYNTLMERVQKVSANLVKKGINKGEAVAVLAHRHPRLSEVILGIMNIGAVYVPITSDMPFERIQRILDEADVKLVVLLKGKDVELLPPSISTLDVNHLEEAEIPIVSDVSPEDIAYIIFTSGSTGRPKGVRVPHRAIVNTAQYQSKFLKITAKDKILQFASPSFDASLSEIFMALFNGASLYHASRVLIDEPWQLRKRMTDLGISVVTFPPSYLRLFNHIEFTSLRVMLTAGEAPNSEDVNYYYKKLDYINAYGPTEAAICAAMKRIKSSDKSKPITLGRPTSNTKVMILDRNLRRLPPGIPGEICLSGVGLADGYLDNSQTKESFIETHLDNGGRLYKTGDIGLWTDEGELLYLGRRDGQVKIHGHRVELHEIEYQINLLKEILQTVVVFAGEGSSDKSLLAYYVPTDRKKPINSKEIREYLRQKLPAYMIPLHFVCLNSIPTTRSGKIDTQKLQAASPQQDITRTEDQQNPDVEKIRPLLTEVFGEKTTFGPMSDLYSLGIDSIKMMRLAHLISEKFAIDCTFRDLVRLNTVQEIANLVVNNLDGKSSGSKITTERVVSPDEKLELTEAQHQLWTLHQMDNNPSEYVMPLVLDIQGSKEKIREFQDALKQAVELQPAYKLKFESERETGKPFAILNESSGFTVHESDLTGVEDCRKKTGKMILDLIHQKFDLTSPPLIRCSSIKLSKNKFRIALCMHHIIGDAQSLFGLMNDAFEIMEGKEVNPVPSSLIPEITALESVYLKSEEAENDLAYFDALLTPIPQRLDLFQSKTRLPRRLGNGDHLHKSFGKEVLEEISRLASESGTTPLGVWIALVQGFLAAKTGLNDIAIAVPVSTRQKSDWEKAAGYFVNTTIIRMSLDSDIVLTKRIVATAKTLKRTVSHSRYPFLKLATELGIKRIPSRAPVVDVLATWSDEPAESFSRNGLDIFLPPIDLKSAKYDAVFLLRNLGGNAAEIVLEYDTDLAEKGEASSLLEEFALYLLDSLAGKSIPEVSRIPQGEGNKIDLKQEQAAISTIPVSDQLWIKLTESWKTILGNTSVDANTDFFESGGDSIKAIRLVSLLRQNGLDIRPAKLFEKPLLGDLFNEFSADKSEVSEAVRVDRNIDVISSGITPIQKWLVQNYPSEWEHFLMSILLEIPSGIDSRNIIKVLEKIVKRHTALHTEYELDDGQLSISLSENNSFFWEEIETKDVELAQTELHEAIEEFNQWIDVKNGKVFGAVLITSESKQQLLIVGHHLVLDAVSFGIIVDEIQNYCFEGREPEGEEYQIGDWVEILNTYAKSKDAEIEKEYWEKLKTSDGLKLPVRNKNIKDRIHEKQSETIHISRENSGILENKYNSHRYGLLPLLLSSFSSALNKTFDDGDLLIQLEGHGRSLDKGENAGNGVGWFTAPYPFKLPVRDHNSDAYTQIEAALKGVPNNGATYGTLFPLADKNPQQNPQIAFNYIPVDTNSNHGFTVIDPYSLDRDWLKYMIHPDFTSKQPLEVTVTMDSEGLHLSLRYHPEKLDKEWIESILQRWEKVLVDEANSFVITCENDELDFNEIVKKTAAEPANIEAVYPLTSSQKGMFYQSRFEGSGSTSYTELIEFQFNANLDAGLLEKAWAKVVKKHQGLRTSFIGMNSGDVRQIVLKKSNPSFEFIDLSQLDYDAKEERFSELLAGWKETVFDLGHGPLIHVHVVKTEAEKTWVIWNCHHILIDGWCIGILLEDLFEVYQNLEAGNGTLHLNKSTLLPYFKWLKNSNRVGAKGWWKETLAAFGEPTTLIPGTIKKTDSIIPQYNEKSLTEETTNRLKEQSRLLGISLPTIIETAWALLLGAIHDTTDVLFGVVTLGRPWDVKGMDKTIGNFIHTLPCRVSFSENDKFGDIAGKVQAFTFEMQENEYLPLADILNEHPSGAGLFDHFLDFHPLNKADVNGKKLPEILEISGNEKIPYPYSLNVVDDKELTLCQYFNAAVLPLEFVEVLGRYLSQLLGQISESSTTVASEFIGGSLAKLKEDLLGTLDINGIAVPEDKKAADEYGNLDPDIINELLEMYKEVLQENVIRPGDSFLESGGHSLSALRLLLKIEGRYGLKLELQEFFQASSVLDIAGEITDRVDKDEEKTTDISHNLDVKEYDLSSVQERLWFLQRLTPDAGSYNIFYALHLQGELNLPALEKAISGVISRHPALRIRVPESISETGSLKQRFADPTDTKITYIDYSKDVVPEEIARESIQRSVWKPFRFGWDNELFRFEIYKLADNDHILNMVFHHIVLDGWSSEIIRRELALFYEAACKDAHPDLEEFSVHYTDFILRHKQLLDSDEGHTIKDRWVSRLTPLPEPIDLPTDFPRPATRSQQGEVDSLVLDPLLTEKLFRFAGQQSVTVFPVLLSAVKILLAKLSGQKDIVVGTPVSGRNFPNMENIVGCFVNTVALRDDIQGDLSFKEIVGKVSSTILEAVEDQLYPFETLVDDLNVTRDPSRNPIFDIMVAIQDSDEWDPNFANIKGSAFPLEMRFSKFDLSFYFFASKGKISLQLEYAKDLFEGSNIKTMLTRFSQLLTGLIESPEAKLGRISLLSDEERKQLVEGFNDTTYNHPIENTYGNVILESFRKHKNEVALRLPNETLSYGSFFDMAQRVSGALKAKGTGNGDFVIVHLERSSELLAAIYGVQLAGCIYVPIDPNIPTGRIETIINDIGDCLLITDQNLARNFDPLSVNILTVEECLESDKKDLSEVTNFPDSLAYSIFTSGSTGVPKGVVIQHRSLLNRLYWMQRVFKLTRDDVLLLKTSISFDVSIWELFWWSMTGASLAILPQKVEREPSRLIEEIEKHQVTVIHFVPSMLRMFLETLERKPDEVKKLKSLRYVIASGEALTPDLVERFNRILSASNGTELHNLYGPTEATVDVTWQPCIDLEEGKPVPIGRPIDNTEIYILDEGNSPVPIGIKGEIVIGGVQVAKEYLNREELNRQKFIENPFNSSERVYRTGDYGRWKPDGTIEYLGRMDNQVKVRGFRIELQEIENVLETFEGIAQAAVLVSDADGLAGLDCYLLPEKEIELDKNSIRSYLAERLPEYMIPGRFFILDDVPLTSSGKLDRKNLHGHLLGGTRKKVESEADEIEKRILKIWKTILPDTEIGINDTFFEVGGDSLRLIRLHEHLEKEWPSVFALAELFSYVTISEQAEVIRNFDSEPVAHEIKSRKETVEEPVAIIGMAVRLADFDDLDHFWADLLAGADRVGELPEGRKKDLEEMLSALGYGLEDFRFRISAYLNDIAGFDYSRFRLAPVDASMMEPEHRVFLETALHALEDGGYGGDSLDGANVGVFVGSSPSTAFRDAVAAAYPDRLEQSFVLNVPSNLATRLSYLKNWDGPAALVDTACSSALNAIHLAVQAIHRGDCEMALVGGVKIMHMPLIRGEGFSIDSASGRTHAFDASASGTGSGEGAVAFLLKPLSAAKRDGDPIHSIIVGSAVNQDGRSAGIAAPNPKAQAEVIKDALTNAKIADGGLDFIETHGTGTVLGDPVEIEGITRALPNGKTKFAIGSVKGNYGHLDAAAGAIGVAKAVMSLKKRVFPHQPFYENPNPRINFDRAPVFVPKENTKLEKDILHGGISSFGLSGVNVHIVLQNAPDKVTSETSDGWCMVPLSASSEEGLRDYLNHLAEFLVSHPHYRLEDISATLALGRDHLEHRIAIWADSTESLIEKLLDISVNWGCDDQDFTKIGKVKLPKDPESVEIEVFEEKNDAEVAAELYINGASPIWHLSNGSQKPSRLHLPSSPFNRKRCWPNFTALQQKRVSVPRTNGFLKEAVKTAQGTIYPLNLTDQSFWPIHEHLVAETPTLVGMGWISILYSAMGSQEKKNPLTVENLSWIQPLRLSEIQQDTISLEFDKKQKAKLVGQGLNEEWLAFTEARLSLNGNKVPEKIDLNKLKSSFTSDPTFNNMESNGLVKVSDRWACRKNLWISSDGNQRLAELELPEKYISDLENYPLHPALMDVAVSLALTADGYLPAACGEVTIYRPLERRIFALSTTQMVAANRIQSSCRIFDEKGNALVELKDMLFLRLISDEVSLYKVGWKETALAPKEDPAKGHKRTLVILPQSKINKYSIEKINSGCELFELNFEVDEWRNVLKTKLETEQFNRFVVIPESDEKRFWSTVEPIKEILSNGFNGKTELLIVGSGAVSLDHKEKNLIPGSGALAGLTASLGWEDNNLTTHYLDADESTTIRNIMAEFDYFQDDPLKAYSLIRDGKRFEREVVPLNTDDFGDVDFSLNRDGVAVITGGLGAMGLTLADILAEWGIGKIALLDLPQALENKNTLSDYSLEVLDKLEEQKISVKKYGCDVANREDLETVLDQVRKDLGPISGIIHTAGVPGGGFLINKTTEEWARVIAPKVDGTRYLHELTLDDPVELFVLASSRTGITGAPGQTDYSAANTYQDSFAYYRRSLGLPALAIDWATWEKAGMAVKSGAVDQTSDTILPEDAKDILTNSLKSGEVQIVVSGRQKTKQVHETPPAEKEKAVDGRVSIDTIGAVWMGILGYDRAIKAEEDFFELGGDSITGMQVIGRIQEKTGKSISLADLFSHSTLESFVENLGPDQEEKTDEIEKTEEQDYPVLWEQAGIIRESLLNETDTAFNLPLLLLLPEEIDFERFADAFGKLISRHEILRTKYVLDNDEPRMYIQPSIKFELKLEKYSGKFDLEKLSNELIKPFDPNESQLFRAKYLTFDSGKSLFYFDIHHSLADAPSLDILMADLAGLYDSADLPPLKKQVKDLAMERSGDDYKKQDEEAKKYWLDLYRGDLPKLDLPSDYPRPGVHTYKGKTFEFKLGGELTGKLRKLAGKLGTTTFNLFLSTWSILLQKYSSQSDLVIATAFDERDTLDLARTPGMLISLVPVRMNVNPELAVKAFVKKNHTAITKAMKHRSFNLTRILGELTPEPTPERMALMEISFSYMNGRRGTLSDGLWSKVKNLTPKKDSSKADISIFGTELENDVIFLLEYYSDLFSEERMERMGQHLLYLLNQLLEQDQENSISSLMLIDQREREILQGFEGKVDPLPENVAIHNLVAAHAEKTPDAIAVIDKKSERTYRELVENAKRIASNLLNMGVQKGEFVAVDVVKEVESAEFILGILMAGGAYLPLDLDLPLNRIKKILDNSESRFLISSDESFGTDACKVIHPDSFKEAVETEQKLPEISGNDAAYMMYTSGSTGEPKGVVIPHRAIYRLVKKTPEIELTPSDCVLQAGNVAFDASTWELWGALANGAKVVFVDKEDLLEKDALENLIKRYNVTVMWLTSSLCNSYADEYPQGFRGLNRLLTGGEKLSVKHIRKIAEACPELTLINGYGPTENTTFTAIHNIEAKDLEGNSIPIGKPIGNTTIHILDPVGNLCPIGVWGELCTGGDGLAMGYWKDEELTAERFIPDPFRPGEKLYRTGDFARWRSDGIIEFLGRVDDQVKIRGFRIELNEIENVISKLEGIRQAAVIVSGEGANKQLIACVVVEKDFDEDVLLKALRSDLPSHMVPSRLIQVEKIPLTSNGKTDRDVLLEKMEEITSPLIEEEGKETLVDENEILIGDLFSNLLKVEGIQPSSNFMELGGHSLMIFRLINRIAEATGKRLTVRDVMSNPTVRSMATLLENVESDTDKIPVAAIRDRYPLSHAQQRVYMQHHLEGAETAYNMPMLFRFGEDFNPDIFRKTLEHQTERHAALRTGFINDAGELYQFIQDKAVNEYEVDDLRKNNNPVSDAVLIIRNDFSRPFDLAKPPLLRTRICRTADDTWYCAICMHHIIGDGWSLRVFFSELGEIYKALTEKETVALKPLPIQYHDFAVWQKQKNWQNASDYWKKQLEILPEPVALPFDYPAPPQRSYRGANEQVMVDSSLRSAIVNKAGSLDITVATYSLGLFAALLYRLARQDDFIIGLGIAGRERKELEDLIGFFVNILPIRISMDEDMDVEELLEMVHANVQKAIEFQDYPFDLLVRDVLPLRENRRDSFINIVFEYQKFEGVRKLDELPSALRQQEVEAEMQEVALSTTTKYDVTLFMIEEQEKLLIRAEYDTDRLSKETIQDWLDGYVQFLEMVSEHFDEEEEE